MQRLFALLHQLVEETGGGEGLPANGGDEREPEVGEHLFVVFLQDFDETWGGKGGEHGV